jgi:thioredoxin reductase
MAGPNVAVVGAGPYGLAISAHLIAAGVTTRVFGETMGFWRNQMPEGMLLRSEWAGSSIASPGGGFSLDRYEDIKQKVLSRRIPLDDFIAYGEWFQQQTAPDLDSRLVRKVSTSSEGFRVELEDGEEFQMDRVIVATGLASFSRRPRAFDSVPSDLALHSSKVRQVATFAGLQVLIVGAGQSALELAALLDESGAQVEVIARAQQVRWLSGHGYLRRYGGPLRKLIYPPGEVGPLGINWIVEYPDLFRKLPIGYQRRIFQRALRPAGSAWLRPRVTNVTLTPGREVIAATTASNRVRLTLDDGTTREVDRVILATGYQIEVDCYPLLDPALAASVRRRNGAPVLVDGFDSSVPGLHFAGAAAADSFGPLLRFVAGTGYTARAITKYIQPTIKIWPGVRPSVEAAAD